MKQRMNVLIKQAPLIGEFPLYVNGYLSNIAIKETNFLQENMLLNESRGRIS